MKFLALDFGDKRIGLAVGDSTMKMATPLDVIQRTSLLQETEALAQVVRNYDIDELVVGIPRNTDLTFGSQAEAARAYAQEVAAKLGLRVEFWDEHLTTAEATRRQHETGARGKKARRNLDAIAAAVILQDFLDSNG